MTIECVVKYLPLGESRAKVETVHLSILPRIREEFSIVSPSGSFSGWVSRIVHSVDSNTSKHTAIIYLDK